MRTGQEKKKIDVGAFRALRSSNDLRKRFSRADIEDCVDKSFQVVKGWPRNRLDLTCCLNRLVKTKRLVLHMDGLYSFGRIEKTAIADVYV